MSFSPVLSSESGNYDRKDAAFFWTSRTFLWEWELSSENVAPFPRMRLMVDGVAATDYVSSTNGRYKFSLSLTNGHHIAGGQQESNATPPYHKGFVVNDTGAPLSEQRPYTATTRFEISYHNIGVGSVQVTYPGSLPAPVFKPLKLRAVENTSELLPKNKKWVRRITANNSAMLTRRFVTVPTGDVAIEADQKYFYTDATSKGGNTPGLETPRVTMRDGMRGVSSLGYVYKFIIRRGGRMAYFMETNGRFGIFLLEHITAVPPAGTDMTLSAVLGVQGEIVTYAGWRVKTGRLKAHGGIKSLNYLYGKASADHRPAHQTYYDEQYEHVGDWSKVPGPHKFSEPWGFAVARKIPGTETIDDRSGLEAWICDTLHHRILFCNMWTSHPPQYRAPFFPPVGYVHPPSVTGNADMALFAGSADQKAQGRLFNEPWDCAVNTRDGKLYWSNFAGNSIARANLDGSNPEIVLACALNPSDAQLHIPKRLEWGWAPELLRPQYLRDGPVGTATCVRPQAIGFNSDGKLIFVERYTYAVRELNLTTMTVRTLATFRQATGSSSASTNDIAMSIDVEGTCGPKDDIYISGWHVTDYRWSKDGVAYDIDGDGKTTDDLPWAFTSGAKMSNGPLNLVDAPGYAWGVGVGDGRILYSGNAAGWQCIEITKRLPTDAEPDTVKWLTGKDLYEGSAKFYLTHGPNMQGELGYPTGEEMGGWDDPTLKTYAAKWGIVDGPVFGKTYTKHDAFVYYVRWETCDHDYDSPVEEDMGRIADLEAALAAAKAEVAAKDGVIAGHVTTITTKNVELAKLVIDRDAAKALAAELQVKVDVSRAYAQAQVTSDTVDDKARNDLLTKLG